jgi:excisionase family DNA binding protein
LSVAQAAQMSSLSKRFLYQKCALKELNHYRLGKRVLIKEEDLLSFIHAGLVEAKEQNR